jgi:hypothetical protein
MKGNQAYRFALDPTPVQEQRFRSHAGAARSAWNWGLDQCRKRSETEKKWESGVDLHRLWNVEKKRNPKLAWWKENATCAGSLPHPGLGAGELHHVQEGRAEGTTNRLPPAQAEGAMPGLLPLRHRGDALLGDHGHPAQVGHHRGTPRSWLRGVPQATGGCESGAYSCSLIRNEVGSQWTAHRSSPPASFGPSGRRGIEGRLRLATHWSYSSVWWPLRP